MSDYADRALSKQEIRQMKEDWRRTDHNLTQVAELHACTRADVVAALGLTEADLKPRQRGKYPGWETQNPEKAAEFVRLLEGGAKMADACKAVGIEKTDTGRKIYNRIRERNALMSNEEKNVTAVAQAIQPPAADQPEPVRPEDYTVDKPAKPKRPPWLWLTPWTAWTRWWMCSTAKSCCLPMRLKSVSASWRWPMRSASASNTGRR